MILLLMSPFILGTDYGASFVVLETPHTHIQQFSHQFIIVAHSGVPSLPRVPCQHGVTQLSVCFSVHACVCSCVSVYNYTTTPQGGTADGEREAQPVDVPARDCILSLVDSHTFAFSLLHTQLLGRRRER